MSNVVEILNASKELNINCYLLDKAESSAVIEKVINKFKPFKMTGHLAIGDSSSSISLEENEFSYSEILEAEPVHMFFDQDGVDQGQVVLIENAKDICRVMENAFGMEYFISHADLNYLIAVNWYVIEIEGDVKERYEKAR